MKKKAKPCYAAKGLPQVPGKPKGTDIIPAWLTPGEAVLSPGAAEMLGRGNVQALNKAASTMRLGTPQYKAMGGMVNDDAAKQAEAKRITDNPSQFNTLQVQAAQAFMNQQRNPQEPQYFMGGTGMVLGQRPMYLAGGVDYIDELARQSKALVPSGPLVSQPYGSVGPGQGFPVQPSAINTGPVSIPKPPPTFNGRAGGFSVEGFEPFKQPTPAPSALSGARSALNAGATPIEGMASSAAKGLGNVASSAGNLASKAGNLAKSTAVGAARVGPAMMGIEGAVRGLNTPTEDYAKRIGINTPTSVPGQLGVRALGVLSDVGASGLGMLGIDQRGKFADVAAQRAQQAGVQPSMNPMRAAQAAEQRQPASNAMQQPAPLGRVGDRLFADQASANAARPKIETDMKQPGYAAPSIVDDAYLQNKGGLYSNRAQVPGYLETMARDRTASPVAQSAMAPQSQPRLGAQPAQQPRLPTGWTQADMDRNNQMNDMARAAVSPQAMRIADIENAGKYWNMVDSLKSGLDNPMNTDDARRSYAAALSGFNGVNQRGTESAASMLNTNRTTDATNINTRADYSAKMNELEMGQGLRDAQSQEALAKAANFQTDANLQQAMLENPEKYAGMRLGSRGTGGQAKGLTPSIRDIEPGQQPYMVTEQGAVPLPVIPTFQQFSSENPNIPAGELRKRYDTLRQRFSEPGLLQQLMGQQGQ